jgi:hypothetical protein
MLKGSPTTFDAKTSKATATSDERYIRQLLMKVK